MTRPWNPRYLAYARSRGLKPEACLEADREIWAGGSMCGFILWLRPLYIEFLNLPENRAEIRRKGLVASLDALDDGHARYDAWLMNQPVPERA